MKAEGYTDCFAGGCAERKNVKNLESKENILCLDYVYGFDKSCNSKYLSVPEGFHLAQLDQCLNYIVVSTSLKTFNCYKRKAQVLFFP